MAIVGAGPAGAFAADRLLRARGDVEIDLFERLPTPWGLLRARRGAGPPGDQAARRDLPAPDARARLPAVRQRRGGRGHLARGPDAPLHGGGLRHGRADRQVARDPGRGPAGQLAGDRVRGLVQRPPGLPRARVRPVGAARGRDRQRQRRGRRDAHAHAQPGRARAHRRRRPRARGAAGEPDRGGRRARPARSRAGGLHERRAARAGPTRRGGAARRSGGRRARPAVASAGSPSEGRSRRARTSRCCASSPGATRQPESPRRIVLRFLSSPVAIRGGERVEAIDVGRNEIVEADDGSLRPRAVGDDVETIECGLVLRSVGYRAVPLPGVPFDERSYILPNERGRVLASDGEPLPGRVRRRAGSSAARPASSARTSATPRRRLAASPRTSSRARCPRRSAPAARRSTLCSPSGSPTWSRSTAGARSTRSSSARARSRSGRA